MNLQKNGWPSAERAAAIIVSGQNYSNIRLNFVSRVLAFVFVATMFAVLSVLKLSFAETEYKYILTDRVGTVVKRVPLDQPNHEAEFIVKWAIDATTRLNTYDYKNYRDQFQTAKMNMTPQGWKYFEDALKKAGILNSVVSLKAVATAVPTSKGELIKEGPHKWPDGVVRYSWRVRFPMLISYQSAMLDKSGQALHNTQSVIATVTIVRMPEYMNPNGIGVRQIILEGT